MICALAHIVKFIGKPKETSKYRSGGESGNLGEIAI
jgi:hypothetical protein